MILQAAPYIVVAVVEQWYFTQYISSLIVLVIQTLFVLSLVFKFPLVILQAPPYIVVVLAEQ